MHLLATIPGVMQMAQAGLPWWGSTGKESTDAVGSSAYLRSGNEHSSLGLQ